MRIIAGELKGKKLLIPLDKSTRPLKDIVRESIFNILEHSNKVSKKLTNSNYLIDDVIEKPSISEAPSNKAVIGRYILPKKIFSKLQKLSNS